MYQMMNAYRRGEEDAALQCRDGGGFYPLIIAATLEELQQFAKHVCLNGQHDSFDEVFAGVDVPFADENDAEDFRAGYMNAVWSHVTNRIAVLEDETRFAAESAYDCADEGALRTSHNRL
jgi:hypothetical protein